MTAIIDRWWPTGRESGDLGRLIASIAARTRDGELSRLRGVTSSADIPPDEQFFGDGFSWNKKGAGVISLTLAPGE